MKKREFIEEVMSIKDQKLRDLLLNPVTHLVGYEMEWNRTGNPAHVWYAIKYCIEEKLEFPPWVFAYLLAVAQRMHSPEARESKDLREILPAILGFLPKAERRGYPLRENQSDEQMRFAEEFVAEIEKGESPKDARQNACRVLDRKTADKVDDKTLKIWLRDYFELEVLPRDNAAWRVAIRSDMKRLYGQLKQHQAANP